ncbi:MAG TPA: homoserine dehydrogenase [Acidobacteriota bacterium]|nr:homoserine dehydrogenase [Acidobacteriota bacterium]
MKILLLGLGRVARRMLEMLAEGRADRESLLAPRVEIAGIFTANHGYRLPQHPEPVEEVLAALSQGRLLDSGRRQDPFQAIAHADYQVLVELTTLCIEEEGRPAADYVRAALSAGRHAVTANKGPMAFQGADLLRLARRRGRFLRFESTVMDGAPVFSLARCGLRGCRIEGVSGILNSTTNFILCAMEEGASLEEALGEARRSGFAEADASHDLQGWDAACKMAVLANALMGVDLHPRSVRREVLDASMGQRAREIRRRGERLRLVSRLRRRRDRVAGEVRLRRLEADDPMARVPGPGGLLRLETDCMGPILITQQAPTLDDTAYGVINDLLEIAGAR